MSLTKQILHHGIGDYHNSYGLKLSQALEGRLGEDAEGRCALSPRVLAECFNIRTGSGGSFADRNGFMGLIKPGFILTIDDQASLLEEMATISTDVLNYFLKLAGITLSEFVSNSLVGSTLDNPQASYAIGAYSEGHFSNNSFENSDEETFALDFQYRRASNSSSNAIAREATSARNFDNTSGIETSNFGYFKGYFLSRAIYRVIAGFLEEIIDGFGKDQIVSFLGESHAEVSLNEPKMMSVPLQTCLSSRPYYHLSGAISVPVKTWPLGCMDNELRIKKFIKTALYLYSRGFPMRECVSEARRLTSWFRMTGRVVEDAFYLYTKKIDADLITPDEEKVASRLLDVLFKVLISTYKECFPTMWIIDSADTPCPIENKKMEDLNIISLKPSSENNLGKWLGIAMGVYGAYELTRTKK